MAHYGKHAAPALRRASKRKGGKRKKSGRRKPLVIALTLFAALIGSATALLVLQPPFARPLIDAIHPIPENVRMLFGQSTSPSGAQPDEEHETLASADDKSQSGVGGPGGQTDSDSTAAGSSQSPTSASSTKRTSSTIDNATVFLIAQCQNIDIYSPIEQQNITGIVFHQASYEWAQVMETQLPEADLEGIYDRGEFLQVNNSQTTGTWVDAEAAHLYRETDSTPMDTSVDCGARAGTRVMAPVTGTVIAVEKYDLYDEIEDVRIHIRPDDNRGLDVITLHQSDPAVKAGDHVQAGKTQISNVRDIAAGLTDIQLSFYTAPEDPGNHIHVQVNDLNDEDYREKYFKGVKLD